MYFGCDVADAGQVQRTFECIASRCHAITARVKSAGIREIRGALELELNEWDRVLQVNLSGTLYCCQAAGRLMPAAGGSVILISPPLPGWSGCRIDPPTRRPSMAQWA